MLMCNRNAIENYAITFKALKILMRYGRPFSTIYYQCRSTVISIASLYQHIFIGVIEPSYIADVTQKLTSYY